MHSTNNVRDLSTFATLSQPSSGATIGRRRPSMRRMANMLSVAVVTFFAVSVTAQTRPDFSGRWATEPVPTAPGGGGQVGTPQGGAGSGGGQRGGRVGDMGSGWGAAITITQDA